MRGSTRPVVTFGVLAIVLLVVLGLRFAWLSKQQAAEWVINGSYWALLALTLWGASILWRGRHGLWCSCQQARNHWPALVVLCGVGLALQLHEPHELKVNYDENVLMGISRTMHYEHMAAWPAGAHMFYGTVTPTSLLADKRPVFFPFLLSLLHNAAGYRVENAYVLNGIVSLVLLGALYFFGRSYGGVRGGLLFSLLIAGVPLVAQNATGGGFDLLNVTLIALTALATRFYLARPSALRLEWLVFLALCLANTRYESILYLIVPVAAFAFVWRQRGAMPEFPPILLLSPLWILPALLSNAVFNSAESFFQTDGDVFWSWSKFPGNLARAVYYLFDPSRGGTNSVLLASLGMISLVAYLLVLRRQNARPAQIRDETRTLWMVGSVIAANVVIALGLRWGGWDDPLVSRFTLPFWFLLGWSVLEVIRHLEEEHGVRLTKPFIGMAAFSLFFFAMPDASMARQTHKLKASTSLQWSLDLIKRHDPQRTSFVLANSSIPYINEGYPAISLDKAFISFTQYASILRYGLYTEVLLVLEEHRNREDGEWICDGKLSDFLTKVRVERVGRMTIDPFYRTTVYRVLQVDDPTKAAPWPKPDPDREIYQRQVYELFP